MEPGYIELTCSHAEKICVDRNWSFWNLMGSAKTTVPEAEYEKAYDFLDLVVHTFVKERAEIISKSLMLWANMPTQILTSDAKKLIVPTGISIVSTEIVCSIKETIGLPEKAGIDLLASVKALAPAGQELAIFDYCWARMEAQMKSKRDNVIADPRPWTITR